MLKLCYLFPQKYIDENPLYEERRNLDRQAGLAVVLETERRRQSELKRKLVEKQKEEKDEKKTKIIKKEETKNIPELGEGANETQGKIDSSGRKMGIKLKLKKEEKEEKKEEKKEEPKKESTSQMAFGKFSWKKTDREDKGLGGAIPKEDGVEGIKEENKCPSGKLHAKPIEIKLSGKTVIPHTSPWTPVVSTPTQAKVLPNLPVPTMIFRKSTTATVSKPPPLNTFLSIKSSGATTKPLPVVKETNTDLLLPPDIISKAFGGEEVILKGSEEDLKAAEKNESSQTSDIPPHHPLLPAVQQAAVIPADEVAPGVSESEQTMLAMLVRPPPPPPPSTAFSEQAKKVEKRNSCLATANAKDLYDIFYSSGGKGSADSKLASSALPNGETSNLAKPADLPANPRTSNSSSSFKEDRNVAAEVSQVLSAKRGSEMEKTVTQQTLVPHSEMSTDIENGLQKDQGQKLQTLSADIQTKLKEEDSSQCNTQVAGSWVLGEKPADMNKKTLQPQQSERSVTELPEAKTASGVQMPAEMGLVDVAGREQAGRKEFCDLQKTEVQGKVGQDDTNKTAVTKTNVPGTLEKDEEMKEVNAVKPELSLEHSKTLLPETQNEIQNLGNSHLAEEKLSDSSRTASKTDSPQLLCGSQDTTKENVLVAVMTEQNSTDTPLTDAKLNSVALEASQPGVCGETPRIPETQNKTSELTRSPGECDTSRTSNGEEQVMTTSSCSESGWELSSTPNIEMKSGSNRICASEFTEIQPEMCLTTTETRNSTPEAQEKIRAEPSGRALLHNQTQRQGVAWLVNACSANIVELRSSVELVVEVEKKSLGHAGSDVILDDIFAKRDAKEVGTAGFSRTCSDLVQESAVALSADVCVGHLSEEAVHSLEKKCEVVRTSAANSDFHLNAAHSGFKTEQPESLPPDVSVDHKKDSLRSENVKHSESPSEKAELEVKSTESNLANTKGKYEHLGILPAGLLNKNIEEVSKLGAIASIRLESSKSSKADIGKPVAETEITDVAALTSGTREDKLCTQVPQTAVSQRGLQSSNSDRTEAGMPVLEMQGVSPASEILLQVEEGKGGAAEMPSLSCDGGSTERRAAGDVETFLPGLKETPGKNGGSGGKGVCTIQSKKTEQTETADSSLEATTNSGIAESVAESPVG